MSSTDAKTDDAQIESWNRQRSATYATWKMISATTSSGPNSAWSRLPLEIIGEIVQHNADDLSTLCALALTSKSVRSSAIRFLFAIVQFSWVEDVQHWKQMVRRTPQLGNIVKEVHFYSPNMGTAGGLLPTKVKGRECRRSRAAEDSRRLVNIPKMPNVQLVSFEGNSARSICGDARTMLLPYLALFPNMTELHVGCILFGDIENVSAMLAVVGKLRRLTFMNVGVSPRPAILEGVSKRITNSFDLTKVEELQVVCDDPADFIGDLLDHSSPTRLRWLTIGDAYTEIPCSGSVVGKLFALNPQLLQHLTLGAVFGGSNNKPSQRVFTETLKTVPPLSSLTSLELWLTPGRDSEVTIRSFPEAPKVKVITLSFLFETDDVDGLTDDLEKLATVMKSERRSLPWTTLVKDIFQKKFPRFERLEFHICGNYLPCRFCHTELRMSVETTVRRAIANVESKLSFRWSDLDERPVEYCIWCGASMI